MLNNISEFEVNLVGDRSGEKWLGTFSCSKCLSHRQQLMEDQVYRELLGKDLENASKRAKEQAELLSRIKVSLTKWPAWWTELGLGFDALDDNLILAVWEGVMKIQLDAFQAVQNKAKAAEEQLKEIAKSDELK
jgi:hypothetical protein